MHALGDGGRIHKVSKAEDAHEVLVQLRKAEHQPSAAGIVTPGAGHPELVGRRVGGWRGKQAYPLTVTPLIGSTTPATAAATVTAPAAGGEGVAGTPGHASTPAAAPGVAAHTLAGGDPRVHRTAVSAGHVDRAAVSWGGRQWEELSVGNKF